MQGPGVNFRLDDLLGLPVVTSAGPKHSIGYVRHFSRSDFHNL